MNQVQEQANATVEMEEQRTVVRTQQVKKLYKNSPFFRALIDNSIMSLSESFFDLTAYMKNDPEFGAFWELPKRRGIAESHSTCADKTNPTA